MSEEVIPVPPRPTITQMAAANMWVLMHRPGHSPEEDRNDLAVLFSKFEAAGYVRALQKAKEEYRNIHSGGCRMLSERECK